MFRTHIPCPQRRTRHVPQARPHPRRHHCDRRCRFDPDLRFRTYARPPWPCHWCGGFAVGIVAPTTVIASECYVVKKVVYTPFGPRSPHYSLKLTTGYAPEGSPDFGSEVGFPFRLDRHSLAAFRNLLCCQKRECPAQGRL